MGKDYDSSDEEDDTITLIHQHDTNNNNNNNNKEVQNHSSAFQIGDFSPKMARNSGFTSNKRYLLVLLLPLLILVVYYGADIRKLFSSHAVLVSDDSSVDRMRESELQALSLLKQQQASLFTLWNVTRFDNSSTSQSLNDLKSSLVEQISLNREIQQALLSSHMVSGSINVSGGDASFGGYGSDGCRKVDQDLSNKRTVEWKPRSDKYLFAICLSGQMSNHLICLEKHMFFAALLNRVLIIPSSKFDYQYDRVLDIEHVNTCLGRKVVMTFEEFSELKKKSMHIDKVVCYFSLPTLCYVDEEHVKKLKDLGLSVAKFESAWTEDIKMPKKRTVQDVLNKFASDDEVLAIGDVFYADLEQEWVMQPGGPIAHKCKTLIEPSHLIMITAQRFIQTFLGKNFIALHFRRHGFLKFCNAKQPSCFFPVPQAAECISRVLERADTPVIYLATDAADSETSLLQSLVFVNGKTVPLVKRPARNSAEKWDALLYRHKLADDNQVEAMLDKTICAMSSVFIGAPGSTFTEDILRLRKDWQSASNCDQYLCQGELPNFIADDE